MCVVSMVHDHFDKLIPISPPWQAPTPTLVSSPIVIQQNIPQKELDELRALIKDFREAVAAAKKVDVLTGQPDCVDPEKAKLEQRVAELESKLAEIQRLATP